MVRGPKVSVFVVGKNQLCLPVTAEGPEPLGCKQKSDRTSYVKNLQTHDIFAQEVDSLRPVSHGKH